MAQLVTANQFNLTPDLIGAVNSGLNAYQQQQAGQRANQQADMQKSQFESQQAQQASDSERQAIQDRFTSVAQAAAQAKNLPDDESRVNFLTKRVAELNEKGTDSSDTQEALELFLSGNADKANALIDSAIQTGVQTGILQAPTKAEGFTIGEGQTRFDAQGNVIAEGGQKLSSLQQKVAAEGLDPNSAAGQRRAREINFGSRTDPSLSGGSSPEIKIPDALLTGLSPDVAAKASASYVAAGGGKDGLNAYQEVLDSGSEGERRTKSPVILQQSFPNASKAEQIQLQAAMDSSKTIEAGLKVANQVRTEQRKTKKAQQFQTRAVELLDGILASDQLGDVIGSIEGSYDTRIFSDDESQLISDINEAGNILTADNLSLMSGVLSESDIKILQNLSGGALNRKRSPERFKKDVSALKDKLSSQKIMTADDVDEARSGPAQTVGRFKVRVK